MILYYIDNLYTGERKFFDFESTNFTEIRDNFKQEDGWTFPRETELLER